MDKTTVMGSSQVTFDTLTESDKGREKQEVSLQTGDWTEVEKTIFQRRSVRWYKSDQVPENLVRRVLEAGRYAPSAGNCQPWKFIVIRDKAILEEMERDVQRTCKLFRFFLDFRRRGPMGWLGWFYSQISIRIMPHELHPIPMGAIFLIAEGKLKLFHGAPTVIMILKDKRGVSNPDLDCGICGQNMVLAARSLGLSTCWIGFVSALMKSYVRFKWLKRLNISYPYQLVEGIALGYAKGNPNNIVERELHEIAWYENGERNITY
ncbi:MAG: nitroreductase [Deltaproteobacteria bacterium]|nr:nitroreductase [Deltaproteobacteria bacterium]